MFNLKILITSIISPFCLFIGVWFLSFLFKIFEGILGRALILIYLEHLKIALFAGIDIEKYGTGGGWISIPIVPWIFLFTIILDYLILVLIIYFLLIISTKIYNYFY